MPVGDAEDKARYARYHRLREQAARAEERAITAPTVAERRRSAEIADRLRREAYALFA
jgi:hypothetical protein